jgi:soluble lytic murein transglycosylase-like protein
MTMDASDRRAMARLCAALVLRGLAFAAAFGQTQGAHADVLEIDADGAVTTYDKPVVTTGQGTVSIILSSNAQSRNAGTSMQALFAQTASETGVSAQLLEAVAWAESRFRQNAVSSAGAIGVMQLMPATAAQLGVDPHDAAQNVSGGGRYLREMLDRFGGDTAQALAAYNAGPGVVARNHGGAPFAETQAYVNAIMDRLADDAMTERAR